MVPSVGCSGLISRTSGWPGVGASPPVRDAVFPVRRQEGGINTGVALHNLLLREGVLRDAASIPLAANGQASWFIDGRFPTANTSDFAGSVRCTAPEGGLFTGVAVELDAGNRIFTTLPWESKIELGEKFFNEIIRHPLPLDMNILNPDFS